MQLLQLRQLPHIREVLSAAGFDRENDVDVDVSYYVADDPVYF